MGRGPANVSLNCLFELQGGHALTTVWLHENCLLSSDRLQLSYASATCWLQCAFGLLSRSRSILRLDRAVHALPAALRWAFGGLPTRLRGHTPYAPTRCRQTRMDPGEFGMTTLWGGTTPHAEARVVAC